MTDPQTPAAGDPQMPDMERVRLRAAQADAVMPLIGPLLDAWECCSQACREELPELDKQLRLINRAMEDAEPTAAGEPQMPEPVAYADATAFESAMAAGKWCTVWPEAGEYEKLSDRRLTRFTTTKAARAYADALAAHRVAQVNAERQDLALMVVRLIRRMRAAREGQGIAAGDDALELLAIGYLQRKGLVSPLRDEQPPATGKGQS